MNARHKEGVLDARDAAMNQTKSLLWGTGSKHTGQCWIREVEEKKQSRIRGIGSAGGGLLIRRSGEGVSEKVTLAQRLGEGREQALVHL